MAKVSLTVLGGFAAVVDGVAVPEGAWRLKKARELVKLLALAPGHRLHREQAMELLWSDREPDAAANNLHQAVYVARRALDASAIEVREEMLHLGSEVDIDLDRLSLAAAEARRACTPSAYRAALDLYAGELLPENRYDDWAAERREQLAELAMELAAELDELGPAVPARSLPVPADPSSFIGRDRELAELEALLRGTRLLTLAGTGGTGKTRLALQLARAAEDGFTDGAALVELAGLANGDRVPDALASALDVRPLAGQGLLEALVDFLAPRSLLLITDNCEHLLEPVSELIALLLRSAADVTILATSREPLHTPGEVVFRVPSLDIPDPERALEPGALLEYEAVQLFVARAEAAAPGFELTEENARDVARICFRLDGLPLAIELAAGRLGALGPAAISERLDDRFRVLRAASRASPTRQHTLAATLQWSHDLLEPDERTLFRRLAVFAGGFELQAAEAVCADGELDHAGSADVLARLVEKSLVAADEGSSRRRRYRLLETVRLYAGARMEEAGETAALEDRHAAWALDLAERERSSPELDREAANLRVALDTLLGRAPEDALRLCLALRPFWLRRIDLEEGQRRFQSALAAGPGRTPLRARALLAAAALDYRAGTLAQGEQRARESLSIASETGETLLEWQALQLLGEFGVAADAPEVAMPWLRRALALAASEGFAAAEAISVYSHGVACWIRGDLAEADELLAESISLLVPLAGSTELITSPLNIAEIRLDRLGDRRGLRILFEDTLQPFAEISCEAAVGYVLASQAGIARVRGDLSRARMLLDESSAHFEACGHQPGRSDVLVRRAYLKLAEGAVPEAREALRGALALRREQSDRRGSGLALAGLGLIDTVAGEHAQAERHLAEAREIFRRSGDRWGLASTLWRTADLALARDDLDGAEVALREARRVLDATGRMRWIANTLGCLADVALLRGEQERAVRLLIEARDCYATHSDALGVADVEERLGELAKGPLSGGKAALDRTTGETDPRGAPS